MKNCKIAIIDSGIGGISILNKIGKMLPNEDYIYYADSIHNPYGDKTYNELIAIMDTIMTSLLKENIKMVIVACNTASTQVISYLREKYSDILFVAVEPAVKLAYDHYRDKNVVVMATSGTIMSERMLALDQKYPQDSRVLLPCHGLAQLIETQQLQKIPACLEDLFQDIEKKKVEVVVLGCTHYPFIKEEIEQALGHKVIFVDGSEGVSKQVYSLLESNNLFNPQTQQGSLSFILTDANTEKTISKYLNSI